MTRTRTPLPLRPACLELSGRVIVCTWFLICCVLSSTIALAAAQPGELSNFLPRPAALYLEVTDPDRVWTEWPQASIYRRAQAIGVADLLERDSTLQRWRKTDDVVATATKTRLTEHLRGICAQGLGLAVFVPEQGEPQGLWLSRARSAETIQATLTAWDQVEPAQRTTKQTANGQSYIVRTVRPGNTQRHLYYVVKDEYFALSDHESLVAECADRLATSSPVTTPTPAQTRATVFPSEKPPAIWLTCTPRAWDRVLMAELEHDKAARKLRDLWKSLDAIAVSLDWNDGVAVTLAATLNPDLSGTSGWSAAVSTRPAGALSVWAAAAPESLFVMGGAFRPAWFLRQFHSLLNETEQRDWDRGMVVLRGIMLNQSPEQEIATALFRDWGVWGALRQPRQVPSQPTDWTIVAQHHLPSDASSQVTQTAIDEALTLTLQGIGLQANATDPDLPVHLERTADSQSTTRRLVGRSDRDFGYQLAGSRLTLGFPAATLTADTSTAESSRRAWLEAANSHPLVFAWCDLVRVRQAFGLTSMDRVKLRDARDPRGWGRLFDQAAVVFDGTPDRIELRLFGRIDNPTPAVSNNPK